MFARMYARWMSRTEISCHQCTSFSNSAAVRHCRIELLRCPFGKSSSNRQSKSIVLAIVPPLSVRLSHRTDILNGISRSSTHTTPLSIHRLHHILLHDSGSLTGHQEMVHHRQVQGYMKSKSIHSILFSSPSLFSFRSCQPYHPRDLMSTI